MLDPVMRRVVDPPLNRLAHALAPLRISPNAITLAGLLVGIGTVPVLAQGWYGWGLLLVLLNRFLDGLDGAVARHAGPTAFGGYLDIVCDAAFYAAVPFGFALATPTHALWAALLLATFVCTMASFLGRAILAANRDEPLESTRGRKSFFYSAGMIEGTETIFAFVLFCMFPGAFPALSAIVSALCIWTVIARVHESAQRSSSAATSRP